jgi:AGCS family alanine or glycine:cation symporter
MMKLSNLLRTSRLGKLLRLLCLFPIVSLMTITAYAESGSEGTAEGIDKNINSFLTPISDWAGKIVFYAVPIAGQNVPIVLILLAGTAIFLTLYFKFINVRSFGTALKTVKGRYTSADAPGQITHFQALSAALSATVGLGNIAGVAVAIGLGGPGATFWMILMGLFGMTTKFCECTLGVKYRKIDREGKVHGGAMYYLRQGFSDRGFPTIGKILAVFFALMCIGGAFGAGNMFQVNQAHDQFARTFDILHEGWQFGLVLGIMVGLVIIGGIVWIARVTSFLVPFMCVSYIIAALVIIIGNIEALPGAFAIIIKGAFSPEAVGGGTVGGIIVVMIQGVKRAAFSNEAGLGSAPIAHAAVKTDHPASEGMVALLEPFVDTVVVCTMTALVIIITGVWNVNGDVENNAASLVAQPNAEALVVSTLEPGSMIHIVSRQPADSPEWYEVTVKDSEQKGWVSADSITLREGWGGGIWLTSMAFKSVISWFPIVLAAAVFLFAFSTMISWSYYGQQAVVYLFGAEHKVAIGIYKVVFCLVAVLGGAASLESVLNLSDAMVFAMVLPNLIGVYFLLPVIKKELAIFRKHVADTEGK